MDIDRFITTNQASWMRLEQLTAMAGSARLGPAEVDEFVQLYQRASTHLSHARTQRADPTLVTRLTRLVADARGVLYGTRSRSLAGFVRFFTTSFPAAVWHARRFVVASALLLFVPAILMGSWLARSDAALEASAPDALREAYVEEDFESYYSSAPASQFATQVTVNNIQVGFLAFALGILLCVPTAYVLAFNGANVGWAAGLFAAVGQQAKFYGLILPHGLLELSAIVVAGAAGLAVGWAIVDPGDRPRTASPRRAGPPLRRDRARPRPRLHRGRHDRGLRHPQRPPHVGARRHRHRRLPRVLDLRHRPRPPRRVEGYTGAFGEHELIQRQGPRERLSWRQTPARAVSEDLRPVHGRRAILGLIDLVDESLWDRRSHQATDSTTASDPVTSARAPRLDQSPHFGLSHGLVRLHFGSHAASADGRSDSRVGCIECGARRGPGVGMVGGSDQ